MTEPTRTPYEQHIYRMMEMERSEKSLDECAQILKGMMYADDCDDLQRYINDMATYIAGLHCDIYSGITTAEDVMNRVNKAVLS